MKVFVMFSLIAVSGTLAQTFQTYDDGRYHPEVYESKFDDGRYHHGKYGTNLKSATGIRASSFVSKGNRTPAKVAVVVPEPVPVVHKLAKHTHREPSTEFIGIKEEARQLNDDSYFYRFVADNDIEVSQSGQLDNAGSDGAVFRVKGFYEYIGDDGLRYRVDYVADENGFQPTAEHLPTPPPVPEEILRSLAKLEQA